MATNLYDNNRSMVVSYLTIRKSVGLLGMALPVLVYSGTWLFGHCALLKPSISDYYYTIMGSVFVGTLCAVALFLFTYKGPQKIDGITSNIAAFFALCIAFFPCNVCDKCAYCNIVSRPLDNLRNGIHYASAALFFITLAYMSIFLFTKTDKSQPGVKKVTRNKVYITCGIIMVATLLVIGVIKLGGWQDRLAYLNLTFWMEFVALWAFGISWLVKGQMLLTDD